MSDQPPATPSAVHDWNLDPTAAVQLQKALRERIALTPLAKSVRLIGGADISFNMYSDIFHAAIVVLDYRSMEVVDSAYFTQTVTFPYIPGLLSFREIPTLLRAWEKLEQKPDVVMVDGHGIAHPRRMGIATHFGLVTGVPTLGCAKKILTGKYREPGTERGEASPILDGHETIGYALRSKRNVKPIFVSPGHLLDLEGALEIARHCVLKHKLPEPTRLAHLMVNDYRRSANAG
ncbi:deoxyribonuclease V [Lewinella aquimaris]|uniref:Endonuclease V n=1 Tax=Neolewinella aquimaris TaxID=1835722 RepID=A0A840DZX3_9BACT|nr:deoxyribonuclease V [Neolewinella aquimaris]MBB4078460.1 deoxyribonuclease V [Neolewinella aquimaris]